MSEITGSLWFQISRVHTTGKHTSYNGCVELNIHRTPCNCNNIVERWCEIVCGSTSLTVWYVLYCR